MQIRSFLFCLVIVNSNQMLFILVYLPNLDQTLIKSQQKADDGFKKSAPLMITS